MFQQSLMTMPKPFVSDVFTLVLNGRNGRNRTDDPCFPKADVKTLQTAIK